MNAIIVSALLGVILMFCSWGLKSESLQKNIALIGLLVLIVANLAQLNGWYVIDIDTKGMLSFSRFGLYAHLLVFMDQCRRNRSYRSPIS
jgi:NADH-quinone oxidoreductase subunit N